MNKSWAVFSITLIGAAVQMQASILGGPILNPANNHTYFLLSQATWTASEAEAVTLGGHLATVNDQAEQDWIWATFSMFGGTPRSVWIGLNDLENEGVFTWISGENASYRHWAPGEPNNNGGENYVHIFPPFDGQGRDGFWNDSANSAVLANSYGIEAYGLVEVPEPSSLRVAAAVPPVIAPPSLNGSNLVLSWPADSLGWLLQSNSAGLAVTNMWFVVPESATTNRMVIPVNWSQTNVLFRLMHPRGVNRKGLTH